LGQKNGTKSLEHIIFDLFSLIETVGSNNICLKSNLTSNLKSNLKEQIKEKGFSSSSTKLPRKSILRNSVSNESSRDLYERVVNVQFLHEHLRVP